MLKEVFSGKIEILLEATNTTPSLKSNNMRKQSNKRVFELHTLKTLNRFIIVFEYRFLFNVQLTSCLNKNLKYQKLLYQFYGNIM